MAYGQLEVICGPMFSGKSTQLLKRALWAKSMMGRRILVLKPAFDDRYGVDRVVNHDGLAIDAMAVNAWPVIGDEIDEVLLDEVQFMAAPHFAGDVPAEVRRLLARGVDVVACGLDLDWRGEPFPVTAALAAMADLLDKRSAICTQCGRSASKSFKKRFNEAVVELGETDKYEARCNAHWSFA
jgi:thymidine kinase